MFKATVIASKLREDLAHYLEMVQEDHDAVQVVHRGSPIRVLITQEHYLNLLARLRLHEKSKDEKYVPNPSSEELMARVHKKLKEIEKQELEYAASKVGRKRAKRT